jgi:outer membrane beta-barrel protein
MFKSIFVVILGFALCFSSNAWSQENSDTPKATTAKSRLDQDMKMFWGKTRKIKVVQKRLFIKDKAMEALIHGGMIPNDDFLVYYSTGIRFGYHFTESLMVEGSYTHLFDAPSELSDFLEGSDIGLRRADIREIMKLYYNVSVLWSPIYGKISLLGQKLTHFDTYIGLGMGLYHTDAQESDENPIPQAQVKPGGLVSLGFRWHLTDDFNIRTEYRNHFFQKALGGVSFPVEINLAVGFKL